VAAVAAVAVQQSEYAPPCDLVILVCQDSSQLGLRVGQRVEANSRLGGCEVKRARPSPCIYTTDTSIRIEHLHVPSVERRGELVVVKDSGKVYVYPADVWNRVMDDYINPMIAGDPPAEPGLLLYGPPGTGKTQMMELIANMTGFATFRLGPHTVYSKYVGTSERNLKTTLESALREEPSVVLIDDAEWLLTSRSLTEGESEAYAQIRVNLFNYFFSYMQDLKNMRRRVLVVAATNMSPSAIDPALKRSGRFGRPVFIPLPSYDMLLTYFKTVGMPDAEADKAARYLASVGASMADAEAYYDSWKKGKPFKFESTEGRGYVRPVPPLPVNLSSDERKDGIKVVMDKLGLTPRALSSSSTRVGLIGPAPFWEALIVDLLLEHGRGSIVVSDARYVDEAVMTAEGANAALIAIVPALGSTAINFIHTTAKVPVFYIASRQDEERGLLPGGLPTVMNAKELIKELRHNRSAISYILKVQLSFANIRYEDSEVQELITTLNGPGVSEDRLINVLVKLTSLPLVESARELKSSGVLDYYDKTGGL
jgi:DNA polymerase III delta prime subunit